MYQEQRLGIQFLFVWYQRGGQMNTDTELHARWLRSQADALVLDYTAEDELMPHKSLYDTLAILLMWRTADDQPTCRQAIEEAAERLAVQREQAENAEWIQVK
jgi:hypothetical protein